MTTPEPATPVTTDAVRDYLHLDDQTDATALTSAVAAVNDLLVDWFGVPAVWPARRVQGGVMLASRIYRRRNSPSGVESFGELGPIYVQRNDPDVAQLLGLGHYQRPAVG
ncbi:hypothetical protein [Rhodococcus tibetensis]|uniref:Phage gp6-like head-tail connector protein n=1 Tax=Rhodococcus tibetensis TaxID=2965064 RepID=A0ABT1QDR8_9NOCA|nr:hypothetical protein [Rhodococcus sp. FXJ9.536]MCQ4120408.1 hypothetical protein [Rhodococcus sp. FXJ9.536]